MSEQEEKKVTSEKPISLAGVGFKKLMSAFLKVKPDQEEKDEEDSSSWIDDLPELPTQEHMVVIIPKKKKSEK